MYNVWAHTRAYLHTYVCTELFTHLNALHELLFGLSATILNAFWIYSMPFFSNLVGKKKERDKRNGGRKRDSEGENGKKEGKEKRKRLRSASSNFTVNSLSSFFRHNMRLVMPF